MSLFFHQRKQMQLLPLIFKDFSREPVLLKTGKIP